MEAILSVSKLTTTPGPRSLSTWPRVHCFRGSSLNVGPIGDVEGRYYHRFAHRPRRPTACKNFLKLCKTKYYNFCLFHNVQPEPEPRAGAVPESTGPHGH